jgi:hypothetical protein
LGVKKKLTLSSFVRDLSRKNLEKIEKENKLINYVLENRPELRLTTVKIMQDNK